MLAVPGLGTVGQASFVEGYGMVEAGGGVAAKISPPYITTGLGDAVGLRLPGYRFRVMDEDDRRIRRWGDVGELHVRGPGLLREYWNSPDATHDALTDDGWLRTGDLVRLGPLGSVLFAGRKKDVIKHGGYSVYAVEVEQVLEGCPVVAEAAVVGLPDERLGEVPVAFIRVVDPGKAKTKAATAKVVKTILAYADEHMAEYKRPAEVHVVDDLPRTGTTKVQKQSLRERLTGADD
jgi:acyl-CoA synthetase (AMP-forming)/AMP-acid ligase II